MSCSIPPPLSDDQLSTALDGEADAAVQQHLDQCPACAARLAQAHQIESHLKTQLHGMELQRQDCPPSHRLGEYHLGLVSQADERTMLRHIEQCRYCRAELDELRLFLSPQPAPAQQPAPARRRTIGPRLGELVARLLPSAEARTRPALALRGGAAAGPIMAEVEGTTLMLDLQPSADGSVLVLGQLIGDDVEHWVGALVELRQAGALLLTTVVDDLCSFSCERVPPGLASLRITDEQGRALLLDDVALQG